MDIIISHAACPDGFCAAYIAKKKYPDAEVIFRAHGQTGIDELIEHCRGKRVLMTDFSLPTKEQNIALIDAASYTMILDHHKTAESKIGGLPQAACAKIVFDMKRSGAGLTWDYLFGRDSGLPNARGERRNDGAERPWYVDYVEDRDLWNWKLTNSKEINAYIGTLPFTFEAWDVLLDLDESDAVSLGAGALAHIEHYVREAVKHTQMGTLDGDTVAVLNVTYLNCSEIGNVLAGLADYGMTWFERGDGLVQFSLRSIGDFDVSKIASSLDGGGHKNAAGFTLPLQQARTLVDGVLRRNESVIIGVGPRHG